MSVEKVSTESLLREIKTLAVGIVDPVYKLALNEFIRRFEIVKVAFDNGDISKVVHGLCEELERTEWYDVPYKCVACGCHMMTRIPSEHDRYPYYYENECIKPNWCANCGEKFSGDEPC